MALSKSPKFSPTLYKALLLTVMSMAFVIPLLGVMLPYMDFFNGMAVQPKLKTQGLYGWGCGVDLPGTLTPPAGAIPRAGYVRNPFADADTKNTDTYAKVLEQAGEYFRNPVTPTLEVLQRGRTLFTIYCGVCHGSEALGDGPVVGPDRFPAPPSLHTDVARAYRDGTLFQIITAGKGNMSSYANKLEPQERWAVIYYVRALQRSLHPKPEDLER